ncbi:hypothetical protein MKX67_03695 [Cytobacillus sp. FSL W7-1323]|uniref:hypothetical protein n=1 Tax=Cytobacillus sp. FSL W7-1323 TaxID=2921700 RepID=UPI0031581EF9
MHVNYYDIKHLFSYYEINLTRYKYFEAAVKKLTAKMKEQDKTYVVTWVSYKGNDDWNIHLKVDVMKMLKREEINEEDYHLIESNVRKFLVQLFGSSEYFDSHILTRIDYRKDVKLLDRKERELLFHLFEKYTKKYRYKEKVKWGKDENGTPFKYETSQYHKNKSIELIVYSKEDERLEKGEEIQKYDKDIVRYELRLKNKHLNSMKREDKGCGQPKRLETYFSVRLWKEYMGKHVLPIVHKGDYYKIFVAEKKIEESHFSKRNKKSLRSFLVMISKGSIDTPKKHMSKPTYRKYLRDLESIGVNPILIPKNRSDFPDYMKNPFISNRYDNKAFVS